ncbi:Myotubularin 1 [Pelomyxa schiedti]|nr:Myotubularin 1 [Pelomyxa schiedti]
MFGRKKTKGSGEKSTASASAAAASTPAPPPASSSISTPKHSHHRHHSHSDDERDDDDDAATPTSASAVDEPAAVPSAKPASSSTTTSATTTPSSSPPSSSLAPCKEDPLLHPSAAAAESPSDPSASSSSSSSSSSTSASAPAATTAAVVPGVKKVSTPDPSRTRRSSVTSSTPSVLAGGVSAFGGKMDTEPDRIQRHYYQIVNHLWHQFGSTFPGLKLVFSGPVTLTLTVPSNSITKTVKFDLKMTTTEVLTQIVKDLGKKVVDQDPSLYCLYLHVGGLATQSSTSPAECYKMMDGAPLWLFHFTSHDAVEIRKKPAVEVEDSVLLKVLVPEQKVSCTIKFPVLSTLETVLQGVNQFNWSNLDVQYLPILSKHLKYYSLLYLSPNQGWTVLEDHLTLQHYSLPNLSIVVLARKPLLELEYERASGPIEDYISTCETDIASKSKKVTLNLEEPIGGTMCNLVKWSEAMFGSIPWTVQESAKKEVLPVKPAKIKPKKSAPSSPRLSKSESDEEPDDDEPDDTPHKPEKPEKPEKPPVVAKPSREFSDDEDEDTGTKKVEAPKTTSTAASSPTSTTTTSSSFEFQLCVYGNSLDLASTMDEIDWKIGQVLTLKMGKNALEFLVTYCPSAELQDQIAIQTGIELEGEEIVIDIVTHVRHLYIPAPATSLTTPVIVMGYMFITNYQLVFRSYQNSQKDEIKIPLASITKIEKFGGKTSALDKYYVDLTCKDFRTVKFGFPKNSNSRKMVVKKLNDLCFVHPKIEKLFSFSYRPPYENLGWSIYDVEKEYERQGLSFKSGWKYWTQNKTFSVCSTYPPVLVVPEAASDEMIQAVSGFRSRQRLPVLSWRNPNNGVSISRSSQPCVGLTGNRSTADEEYLRLIQKTNLVNPAFLYILDSRPKANAIANRARGGGYEDTGPLTGYPTCKLEFEDIANIHVVRENYLKLRDLCSPATVEDGLWFSLLDQTHWLDLLKVLLTSVTKTVKLVDKMHVSVLVHCSDGYIRFLSPLPFHLTYCAKKTLTGFEVLIEKEWLSFGHKFHTRYAHGDPKPSEQRSPIFPQFVECVYQLLCQFPMSFQFNEQMLLAIMDHLYSCQFGTFLCDSAKQRAHASLTTKTVSLWSYINYQPDRYVNPFFVPDDTVLYPDPSIKTLKLWESYHLRWYYKLETDSPVSMNREKRSPKRDFGNEECCEKENHGVIFQVMNKQKREHGGTTFNSFWHCAKTDVKMSIRSLSFFELIVL